MIELVTLAILALAAYRLTRLVVIDTLLETPRLKFHSFLINRNGALRPFWTKIYELTSCTWCTGFWVSAFLYGIYLWQAPWDWSRLEWISVFAVTGAQGLLHAFEPDED